MVFDPADNRVTPGNTETTTFTISVDDGSGAVIDNTTTVISTSVNDSPTAILLDNVTVTENNSGAVIGNLSTTDPDAGDTHTYTVDDARFEVVSGQLKLKAGQSVNFETEPTVDVTVTSTDAGGLSTNQLFTITVTNANEAPTAISISASAIDENTDTTGGISIGTLTATDPDTGDTFSYGITDTHLNTEGAGRDFLMAVIKIENVVASTYLGGELDLQAIALALDGADV